MTTNDQTHGRRRLRGHLVALLAAVLVALGLAGVAATPASFSMRLQKSSESLVKRLASA